MAGYKLCRFCCWSSSVNTCQSFLQPASPAYVGAITFAFRAGLDRLIRIDGYSRLASLAVRGIPHKSHHAFFLFWATRIERLMELALLCLAPRRVGICRHHVALGPYRCHPRLFLSRTSSCWRSSHSVLAMGQFRISPQLLCMAAQPPGSKLVVYCLTSACSRTRQGRAADARRWTDARTHDDT